ncbi:nitroreductase family protein [Pseudoruegeria sp. HB172150]|uniref:nitroreductase family protein n=1 Tax=Pseudoruegeria sp. HB172150 TaxID=2721164 RepID=UPI001554BFD4|nr:nitroreductase family protein [Pseudoruegeria sp. HB172150]
MRTLKTLARSLLGSRYQNYLVFRYRRKLKKQYAYDFSRYSEAAYNSWSDASRETLEAQVVLEYHRIEKGLALPNPKPLFGLDVVRGLIESVTHFETCFGSTLATERARAAIASYVDFNGNEPELDFIPASFRVLKEPRATIEISRKELEQSTKIGFEEFARSRHSIRNFSGAPIDVEQILEAVSIAQTAPSVCNRQSGRVHVMVGREQIDKALSFQNGNRGFGHLAGAVLIVTSDMRTFAHSYERNQCWVDGGLFAMMLNLGLHAQGFGTCMLNWSADADRDQSMRSAFDIPDHECVITMMAVGHVPTSYQVARSARPGVEAVATVHQECTEC